MSSMITKKSENEHIRADTVIARENLPIVFLAAIYVGAGVVTESVLGLDGMMKLKWGYTFLNDLVIIFFVGFFGIQLLLRPPPLREGIRGLMRVLRTMRERYFTLERTGGFLLVYAIITPFQSTFTSFKEAIPLIQPFTWDQTFMELDYALHLGHHPWVLLQPLVGHPGVTRAIDFCYMLWFLLLFAFPLWMTWSAQRRLRSQFFISFALVWIFLGTVLATLFSSAGPCYYTQVTGAEDPFAPLMAYLDSVHETSFLWAVKNQRGLWAAYVQGVHLPFGGISAMPSLHVAAAVLFALVGWQVHRWFGLVLAGYAVVIQLGAVHLGWHYAIDSYFSALLTWLIWKATDRGLTIFGWEPAEGKQELRLRAQYAASASAPSLRRYA